MLQKVCSSRLFTADIWWAYGTRPRGFPTRILRAPHLHEREQLPYADELVEGSPGSPQVLVGVEALAILDRELPQVKHLVTIFVC